MMPNVHMGNFAIFLLQNAGLIAARMQIVRNGKLVIFRMESVLTRQTLRQKNAHHPASGVVSVKRA